MYDLAYCTVRVRSEYIWECDTISLNFPSCALIFTPSCLLWCAKCQKRFYYYFVMILPVWDISRYFLLPYLLSRVVRMLLVGVSLKRTLTLCEYLFCLTPPSHLWYFTPFSFFDFGILFPVFLLYIIILEVDGTLLVGDSHKRCLQLGQYQYIFYLRMVAL